MAVAQGTLRPTSHMKPQAKDSAPTQESRGVVLQRDSDDMKLPAASQATVGSMLANGGALDSKTVLDALLAAGGDLELTCELLGDGPGKPLHTPVLVKLLAEKPALLQRSLRVFAMLSSYDLMNKAGKILQTDMTSMETADLAKTYDRLATQLEVFTKQAASVGPGGASPQVNVNILLESMPREAANAVKQLATLSPEQLEAMRRAQMHKRMLGDAGTEDGDYETRSVA